MRLLIGFSVILAFGVVHAEEFTAVLVKAGDGKVTLIRGKTKKDKKELTLSTDENVRIVLAKYDAKTKRIEAGDDLAGGLKNPIFQQLDKEIVQAWVRTNADNDRILELRLFTTPSKKKIK